jgi:hypothetical protein
VSGEGWDEKKRSLGGHLIDDSQEG